MEDRAPQARLAKLRRWLAEPIDAASIGLFRLAFGAIMLWEIGRYFSYGWVQKYFVVPEFTFKYAGFEWLEAWPEPGMTLHFVALGGLAVAIAAGVAFRLCCTLFGLGFAYVFLLEQARYLNHFYFVLVLCFLLSLGNADRAFSLRSRGREGHATLPRWQLVVLRAQLGIVYVYAGIAKLNPDWLAGEPMRAWLSRRTDYTLIGPWLGEEWVVLAFSYGGLALDLLVVPGLLWRRTRVPTFLAAAFFHGMNAWLFSIGIFPWLMLAATTLFFEPDWPRRLGRRWLEPPQATAKPAGPARSLSPWLTAVLASYLAVQLLLPLRHHLYPGPVHWTEEGHILSWRMMLREKRTRGVFAVTDLDGDPVGVVDPHDQLPRWQANAMMFRPELVRQFAHHIARTMHEREGRRVRVYARISVSLNSRPEQFLVNPRVDLAAEPWTWGHAEWIRELQD